MKTTHSIQTRFLLAFLGIVVVPTCVLLLWIAAVTRQTLVDSTSERIRETMAQVARELDAETRALSLLTSAIYNDKTLLEAAVMYESAGSAPVRYSALDHIESILLGFLNLTGRTGVIKVTLADGTVVYQKNTAEVEVGKTNDLRAFPRATSESGLTFLVDNLRGLDPGRAASSPMISVLLASRQTGPHQPLASVACSFVVPLLDQLSKKDEKLVPGKVSLINGQGDVILSNGTVQEAPGEIRLSESLDFAGWSLVSLLKDNAFTGRLDFLWRLLLVSFLVLVLVYLAFSRVFFGTVLGPLRRLASLMIRVAEGNYDTFLPDQGRLEFSPLTESFNEMVSRIKVLTEEKQANERERFRTELEMLQYQINPHFLANTLNNIKIMAGMVNAENIRSMTAALIRILTSVFAQPGQTIPLSTEIGILRAYADIMSYRFGPAFRLEVDISPEAKVWPVPKMLLQPLVENAILHGRGESGNSVCIQITGHVDGAQLKLSVSDDGVGMPAVLLSELLLNPGSPGKGSFARIGLYNVHRRIGIIYGEGFGLAIESALGSGTTIRLDIPFQGGLEGA